MHAFQSSMHTYHPCMSAIYACLPSMHAIHACMPSMHAIHACVVLNLKAIRVRFEQDLNTKAKNKKGNPCHKGPQEGYPTPGEPLEILKGIDLELSSGDNLAIIGPSGSGKSTLLNVLGTLDHPTGGSYTLNDTDPFSLDEDELAAFRNANIGFIFQEHHLLPQLSVLENVLIPTMANGKPVAADVARAEELVQRVGLADRSHHRPAELSGGERERVAVARSLICSPSLVLADEPTGNLDHRNAQQIGELLLEIQDAESMALIVVTHSRDLADMLGRKLEINDGRLSSATV